MEYELSFNAQHTKKMLIQNHCILCMDFWLYDNKRDFKDKTFWSVIDKKKSGFYIINQEQSMIYVDNTVKQLGVERLNPPFGV